MRIKIWTSVDMPLDYPYVNLFRVKVYSKLAGCCGK